MNKLEFEAIVRKRGKNEWYYITVPARVAKAMKLENRRVRVTLEILGEQE